MKCSATTRDGRPCPAPASRQPDGPPLCPMHGPKAKLYQRRGAAATALRRALPATYRVPEFASPEAIISFARELARLALTEDVDPRRLAEARGAAALALSGHSALTQQKLVEALLRAEHGGAAVALLMRLTEGLDGRRRPLPGRVPALVPSTAEPPGDQPA